MGQSVISVIIPVYNVEQYLPRCLDSVLSNTYRNLEIICVDDGSTDGSAAILQDYAKKDSRIVVITKENGGVSSARNAGLDRMTGEFVTFIDSDDFVHPQYVELLYHALLECGTSVAIRGFQIVDDITDSEIPGSYSLDLGKVRVCSLIQIFKTQNLRAYCWGKLIHCESVKSVRFCEELNLAEDTTFVAEVYEKGKIDDTTVLSYPLYYYYQREGSAVKVAKNAQLFRFGSVWNQRLQRSDRDDIYLDKAIKWYLSLRYQVSHIYPDREAVHECNKQLKMLRRYIRKTNIYKITEKAAFLTFIRIPGIYRLHRIVGDPSIWKWEKIERQKRMAERKKRSSKEST